MAAKVAPYLSGYTVDPDLPYQLCGPDGATLVVLPQRTKKPRVEVTGCDADASSAGVPFRITAAATRSGEAIAADIRRKLLPGYVPALAEANRLKAAARAADRRRHQRARQLATKLEGASVRDWCPGNTTVHACPRHNPHAGTLNIRINANPVYGATVTVDQASPALVDAIVDFVCQHHDDTMNEGLEI